MRTRLTLLFVGVGFAWLAASYPALKLGGWPSLACDTAAALLCVVPAALTLAWGFAREDPTPSQLLQVMVGSTLLRMAFVAGGGLVLYLAVPPLDRMEFWVWVLGFYLLSLALETALLTRKPAPAVAALAGKNEPGA